MDTAVNMPVSQPAPRPRPRKRPLGQRVNIRMLVFAGIALLLIGYPLFLFLEAMITKGISGWKSDDKYGQYRLVNLKQMSDWAMEPTTATDAAIPPEYRALDGQRVMLVGEIPPFNSARPGAESDFDLVWSVAKCCFTGKPQIQHFVKCTVVPERRTKVRTYDGTVKVVGTLHAGIVRNKDNSIVSVYRMDVEHVDPTKP
jgi:hypothetical protein